MNEELNTKLIESIDKVLAWVESTEGFVSDQAPLVAQEIVSYGRAISTTAVATYLMLVLITIPVAALVTRWGLKQYREANKRGSFYGDGEEYAAIAALSAVAGLVIASLLVAEIFFWASDFIMAWFAPRLYILEYANRFV